MSHDTCADYVLCVKESKIILKFTLPSDVKHWYRGIKSTMAARVILEGSILRVSVRAAAVHALQAEDL